jgi:hypothetical protein
MITYSIHAGKRSHLVTAVLVVVKTFPAVYALVIWFGNPTDDGVTEIFTIRALVKAAPLILCRDEESVRPVSFPYLSHNRPQLVGVRPAYLIQRHYVGLISSKDSPDGQLAVFDRATLAVARRLTTIAQIHLKDSKRSGLLRRIWFVGLVLHQRRSDVPGAVAESRSLQRDSRISLSRFSRR